MNRKEKLFNSAIRKGLHRGVPAEETLRVLSTCHPTSGQLGYAHDYSSDHQSDDYRAVIACVYCGFLVWHDHLPASHTLAVQPVGISVYKITDLGKRYLETVERARELCQRTSQHRTRLIG